MNRETVGLKLVTIVGARPQFIKAAAVTPALKAEGIKEILVHTGQHYDWEMSESFFKGFRLPRPRYNLEIGSAPHGAQTGRMLEAVERVLLVEKPDAVLIYGDTNSTLAGALAAVKLDIPVAHVEAGLRSFDGRMPEEINRVAADHMSSLLFAPTGAAIQNLKAEGLEKGVVRTGDVMYDLFLSSRVKFGAAATKILKKYELAKGRYAVATVHRAENTDSRERWEGILAGLRKLSAMGVAVIWPAHPRTRSLLKRSATGGLLIVPPLPYFETQALLCSAKVVLTDSGGLQKEAAFHGVPCVVLRDRTEWVELAKLGLASLSGTDSSRIAALASRAWRGRPGLIRTIFGDGKSSRRIAARLASFMAKRKHAGA